MSRLIVKNLAKSVSAEKLKEVFGQKGVVTDVQLKYTADGKFRHFGFVGFRNEEEGLDALNYFNNTFINGSRVKVEQCAGLGDPNKPKAWSKYASDSSAFKEHSEHDKEKEEEEEKDKGEVKKKKSVVADVLKKYENDPMFAEFMEARSKGKQVWSNDNIAKERENLPKSGEEEDGSASCDLEGDSRKEQERGMEAADDDDDDDDDDNFDSGQINNLAKADISDMDYLKMKTRNYVSQKQTEIENESKPAIKKLKAKKDELLYTVKVRNIKFDTKKKDFKQFFHPLKLRSIRLRGRNVGVAYIGFATEKEMKCALKKHMSFLDGRRISVTKHGGDGKHSTKALNSGNKWEKQTESLQNEESIAESGRIFVRNLAYTVAETDIEALFSKFGPLTEVAMPIDRTSRKPKGFSVITFLIPEHAVKAYTELDGSIFHGRMLHLLPGKYKKSIEEMLETEGLTFKEKKALKMKAQATASFNWNTLFLGQNAVADLIAKNYNTTKEKVLDVRGKESLAVRLALGETQIVNETRQFLLENGVQIDAFNQVPAQRSKNVILAKNLPAETTDAEIHQLFAKFGELGRVILPPSGVTAIVEFLEPAEARAAFRKLAYSKFKDLPLFLEWAPSNAFSTPYSGTKKKISKGVKKSNSVGDQNPQEEALGEKEELSEDNVEEKEEEEEEEDPEPDTTLFIKNLKFGTEEEAIKTHFKNCGPIYSVSVPRKKDPKNPGKFLSMGYAFIQFKRKVSLEKALKSYQNSILNEHAIELKRSNKTLEPDIVTARKTTRIGKQTGTKILVRNIPFQATIKEIRELFKTFGEIKFLRLPQKMAGTGGHRGFGFVEYYTKHDAKRAFKALCQSTHLYGRRLVLEWAKMEEDVNDIRKRTASQFVDTSSHYQAKKGVTGLDFEED